MFNNKNLLIYNNLRPIPIVSRKYFYHKMVNRSADRPGKFMTNPSVDLITFKFIHTLHYVTSAGNKTGCETFYRKYVLIKKH